MVVLSLFALSAACGFSAVGTGEQSAADAGGGVLLDAAPGSVTPGPSQEGGSDAETSPPPCVADACSLVAGSAPFRIVLYGERSNACPTGFGSVDVVTKPVANAGACTCGPCVTNATCTTGLIGTKYSSNAVCGTPAGDIDANNGACFPYNGNFVSTYCVIVPPPAVPGACSAPGVGVPANVATEAKRICNPQVDSCAAVLCAPPGSLKTCIAAPGDVECPGSAMTKTVVGANVDVTCPSCTCTTKATCAGAVTFYSGANCTGGTKVLDANVCTQVNGAGIMSTKWAGVVTSSRDA